jgi:hypothetical protein
VCVLQQRILLERQRWSLLALRTVVSNLHKFLHVHIVQAGLFVQRERFLLSVPGTELRHVCAAPRTLQYVRRWNGTLTGWRLHLRFELR